MEKLVKKKNKTMIYRNVLQVIELADVCSTQTWMPPSIDEYVPSDACLDSSGDDIPGMEILLIGLTFLFDKDSGPWNSFRIYNQYHVS